MIKVNYFRRFPEDTKIPQIDIRAYTKDPCKKLICYLRGDEMLACSNRINIIFIDYYSKR